MNLRKLARQGHAKQRQAARATRTNGEQLLRLDKINGGKNKGAKRERARLLKRIKQS
jgi:hypothetical protein